MKVLVNEISSKKWGEISNSIHKNYGGADFPGPKATRFDDHGNPVYGRKGKPIGDLYRKIDAARADAKEYEQANDPIYQEARELWNEYENDVDWDRDAQEFSDEGGHGAIYGSVQTEDGWTFEAEGYGYDQGGDLGDITVSSVHFTSPDGQEGDFRP